MNHSTPRKVQFGLMVPGDALGKSRRHRYMEDVNRLLNTVKGSYHSVHLGGSLSRTPIFL